MRTLPVRDAIETLAETEAVFSHPMLVQRALANGMCSTDVAAVEAAIARFREARRLEAVDDNGRAWGGRRHEHTRRRCASSMRSGEVAMPWTAFQRRGTSPSAGIDKH